MNPEILCGIIGMAGGVIATFIGNMITSAKHEQRLDEHDRRFTGVDKVFSELDSRFVPRSEIDARLKSLSDSQERIEKLLNLVLPFAVRQGNQ